VGGLTRLGGAYGLSSCRLILASSESSWFIQYAASAGEKWCRVLDRHNDMLDYGVDDMSTLEDIPAVFRAGYFYPPDVFQAEHLSGPVNVSHSNGTGHRDWTILSSAYVCQSLSSHRGVNILVR
jgi:hypothetical protein